MQEVCIDRYAHITEQTSACLQRYVRYMYIGTTQSNPMSATVEVGFHVSDHTDPWLVNQPLTSVMYSVKST